MKRPHGSLLIYQCITFSFVVHGILKQDPKLYKPTEPSLRRKYVWCSWKSSLLTKAIPLQMLSCSNTQMTQHTFVQKEKIIIITLHPCFDLK